MKALVKARPEAGLWLQDIPEPVVGINDVLVRVSRTGICGTDLHSHRWDAWAREMVPVGLVVGHEFVGEVVEVGSNVSDFQAGDVVSGEGHLACGRCRNCMAGHRHLCAHTRGIGVNHPGCELAEAQGALVMVDDSHAVGFLGPTGRGTPELFGVGDRLDIVTGTLGKALGGANGGYTSGRREIAASLKVLDLLEASDGWRERLSANTTLFREQMVRSGFDVLPGDHPIVPIMCGHAAAAAAVAGRLLEDGIYVVPFSYPVVPRGAARIRTQLSAAHTTEDLERAVAAFVLARPEG